MGLLYVFPDSIDDSEHVKLEENTLCITSYSLPYIFYGYFAGVLIVLVTMYALIHNGLDQLLQYQDPIDIFLAYSVYGVGILIFLTGIFLLTFKKSIIIHNTNHLQINYKALGITFFKKSIEIENHFQWIISKLEPTPNVAKVQNDPAMARHFNKGYFELQCIDVKNNRAFRIDRSNQKRDLTKLLEIIQQKWKVP